MAVRWGWILVVSAVAGVGLVLNMKEEEIRLSESQPERAAAVPAGLLVTREQLGERWPFSVSSGYADCVRSGAVFRADGKTYALTGFAQQLGYSRVEPIWLENPENPGTRVSIGPILGMALDRCP